MEANWQKILGWVLISEGGNDDDPDDAGGRTSRGITQHEYNAYCTIAGLPHGDVWHAPDQIIHDIYHRSYWMPYGPILPSGVDYVFVDECVNAGPSEASYLLQKGLVRLGLDIGPSGVDRHIGVSTSAAIIKADPKALVATMSIERIAIYKAIERRIPRDRKFDRGWMNRVAFCEKNALTLVTHHDQAGA